MNAAEHDVFGRRFCGFLTEHERIAKKIGVHDDAVALVVVAEDEQIVPQHGFEFFNPVGNGLLFHGQRGVHEINRAHGEGDAHGPQPTHAPTLFQ